MFHPAEKLQTSGSTRWLLWAGTEILSDRPSPSQHDSAFRGEFSGGATQPARRITQGPKKHLHQGRFAAMLTRTRSRQLPIIQQRDQLLFASVNIAAIDAVY